MKSFSIFLFALLLNFSAFGQDNKVYLMGDWEGTLSAQGKEYKVIFHINYDGKTLSATLDSPDQNVFGFKVDEISYSDDVLKMKIDQVQGDYEGTVKEKKLEGKWTQGGATFDLNLEKTKKRGSS